MDGPDGEDVGKIVAVRGGKSFPWLDWDALVVIVVDRVLALGELPPEPPSCSAQAARKINSETPMAPWVLAVRSPMLVCTTNLTGRAISAQSLVEDSPHATCHAGGLHR
jgi:hypothetical protein